MSILSHRQESTVVAHDQHRLSQKNVGMWQPEARRKGPGASCNTINTIRSHGLIGLSSGLIVAELFSVVYFSQQTDTKLGTINQAKRPGDRS